MKIKRPLTPAPEPFPNKDSIPPAPPVPPILPIPIPFSTTQPLLGVNLDVQSMLREMLEGRVPAKTLKKI